MTLDISRHKAVLVSILKDIYTDNLIGPILGFKGGTAAFLFYGLERFSVDLDFDLLDPEKGQHVFERLKHVLSTHGAIKMERLKRFTIFFELSYEDGERNIKVEVNNRQFGSKFEVANYFGISMKVMAREDMFANKSVAMFERLGKTTRDIFDVWYFMSKNWPVNKTIVEQRTGMKFKDFLLACIAKIEKLPDRAILSGMGELLDAKQKAWAKAKLKTELLFYLKFMQSNER